MRKILFSSYVTMIAFTTLAQDSMVQTGHTQSWYLKKSRRQKIVGASLVTVGTIGLLSSMLGDAADNAGTSLMYQLSGANINQK